MKVTSLTFNAQAVTTLLNVQPTLEYPCRGAQLSKYRYNEWIKDHRSENAEKDTTNLSW